MIKKAHMAGGKATEAGMEFQARVATWFAAQLLSDMPIGNVFGLPATARVAEVQCETGDAMDDVVVRLADGATIHVQCKTTADIAKGEKSPLGSTLKQVVRLYLQRVHTAHNAARIVAILAVSEAAPRSLDDLESACRMFDLGGEWGVVKAQLPEVRRRPLEVLEQHFRREWSNVSATPIDEMVLANLARIFRIVRFPDASADNEWRQIAQVLGRRVYGDDADGTAPMDSLLGIERQAIRTGAPANREGLLLALRAIGHFDVASPNFDADIQALLTYSKEERRRLEKHTKLPFPGAQPIRRDCLEPLLTATADGSLLVTGEPGAGKTGVLLRLADLLDSRPGPVIFLSVERFSGFTNRGDFKTEIGLTNDLIEILAAWPGDAPGTLIIDALDASRGGLSEPVIAAFIADAVAKVGRRWSVIASIRSFDLRNGRRFKEVFRGAPPDVGFAESDLVDVRHFHVARLSPKEVSDLAAGSPKLRDLEADSPPRVLELLRNIFNLSLATELLAADVDAAAIKSLATQSQLIDKYEDIRLTTHAMRRAVTAAVKLMVQKRRLVVPEIAVNNDAVDAVRASGVLVSAGRDTIAFAHHVLFDHITGRFFLAADDPAELRQQLSGDPTIGLLLGPALRFALERMWHDDEKGRPKTWGFLADLCAEAGPDPVVLSTAFRTVAEQVEASDDVIGLSKVLKTPERRGIAGKLLGQLSRFVGLVSNQQSTPRMSVPQAQAWVDVSGFAVEQEDLRAVDAARILLMSLAEQPALQDLGVQRAFGACARGILTAAWDKGPDSSQLAAAAIRFVTQSFGSDPEKSRELLERILKERLKQHAPEEAPWLARGVADIFQHDPAFVVRIYSKLFEHDVDSQETTFLGGSVSRILPLMSTVDQDYEHARWQLNQSLKSLFKLNSAEATKAAIAAVRGTNAKRRKDRKPTSPVVTKIQVGERTINIIDDLLSLQDWRQRETRDNETLSLLVAFLKECSADAFRSVVDAATVETTNAAIWARIFGVAADRPGVAVDLLWSLVAVPAFLAVKGLTRDAVIFIGAGYSARTDKERETFETGLLAHGPFSDEREATKWRYAMARLLSTVPEDQLATDGMRALRADLNAARELTGNEPGLTMSFGWGGDESVVDGMLRSGGADLEKSPDREIRAASRLVEDDVRQTDKDSDSTVLATMWAHVVSLVRLLDESERQNPHPQLIHSSWGAVCNGVERLASLDKYEPGTDGQPDLNELLALIDRLAKSPYPELRDASSSGMSWGNWDVRVYAAESLIALVPRFGAKRPDLIELLVPFLDDPVPTVRHQISSRLNVLWNVAHDRMWELAEKVAESERDQDVLAFYISGPLGIMAGADAARVTNLLSPILEREWVKAEGADQRKRDVLGDATANLIAYLYVASNRAEAWSWIERWISDVRRGEVYLGPMLHNLREAFFLSYRDGVDLVAAERAERARQVIGHVTKAAAVAEAQARPHLHNNAAEAEIALWQPVFLAADSLIDQICNQLYFGSGAFKSQNDNDPVGLPTAAAKRQFLHDYGEVLDTLERFSRARTVYNLIGLYSFLIEGNPEAVFDRVVRLLLGAGADDAYQYESLGSDGLVELVRRYLADHRDIFDTRDRRAKLIQVLELFSKAGWPEALRLMFELPDLLR